MRDRRDVVERKVQQLNEAVDENMRDRERDWQKQSEWMVLKAQRKLKPKKRMIKQRLTKRKNVRREKE